MERVAVAAVAAAAHDINNLEIPRNYINGFGFPATRR